MIKDLIQKRDISQIFRLLKNGQHHSEINQALLKASILEQYYYIKTLKLVSPTHFSSFAEFIAPHKTIFRNILTMYGNTPDSLNYGHPVEEGLPTLQEYYDIAKQIF